MPPEHMQNSLGRLCLRVQSAIPSRPERKKRPSISSQATPWLWPTGPSLAMLAASEHRSQTRRERFFRTTKPVPNSAPLATNIASIGGAGVRHGEHGGDVFFSLGTDSGAMVLQCYLRVCVLCGAWMLCRAGRLQARATDGRETLGLRSKPRRPLRLTHIEERTRLSHLDRTGMRCCCRKYARSWGFCRNCRNRVGTA